MASPGTAGRPFASTKLLVLKERSGCEMTVKTVGSARSAVVGSSVGVAATSALLMKAWLLTMVPSASGKAMVARKPSWVEAPAASAGMVQVMVPPVSVPPFAMTSEVREAVSTASVTVTFAASSVPELVTVMV